MPAVHQVLQFVDIIAQIPLLTDRQDQHVWTPAASGNFSTKSAYVRYFTGSIPFEPYKWIWKAWAPLKVKIFIWLAVWRRCWTADRLQRRGLQHPDRCVLCDQETEDIDHLLLRCSFSKQVWFTALEWIGHAHLTPTAQQTKFVDWWRRTDRRVAKETRKGLNSFIQLVAWFLWKHRNACLFDESAPNVQHLLAEIRDEATLWGIAGARRLSQLL